jgi:hypothetical protein
VDFGVDFLKEPCLWHIEADMPAGFVGRNTYQLGLDKGLVTVTHLKFCFGG